MLRKIFVWLVAIFSAFAYSTSFAGINGTCPPPNLIKIIKYKDDTEQYVSDYDGNWQSTRGHCDDKCYPATVFLGVSLTSKGNTPGRPECNYDNSHIGSWIALQPQHGSYLVEVLHGSIYWKLAPNYDQYFCDEGNVDLCQFKIVSY